MVRIFSIQTAFPPAAIIICLTVSGSEHCFEIMHPERDASLTKWNMDLFFEATDYFRQNVLDVETDDFELINQQTSIHDKSDVIY